MHTSVCLFFYTPETHISRRGGCGVLFADEKQQRSKHSVVHHQAVNHNRIQFGGYFKFFRRNKAAL